MADADYFLDMSSSPDPLADDDVVPSSAQPATRRITKSRQELASFMLNSSPQRLRSQSPRKRTFQLDVGDERSPQRIRVTVEAEESMKHDTVNRRLFTASPSPVKNPNPRRRETITTTVVPLNDDGEVTTPRKRGRKRRTSNGTPMPRTRKRAGTPIRRKSKQARLDDGPSSDTGFLRDASEDIRDDGDDKDERDEGTPTPRPATRTRKTPTKPPADVPIPSSQISTKRKRGRPRKVPLPEEPEGLTAATGTKPESIDAAVSGASDLQPNTQHRLDVSTNMGRNVARDQRMDDDTNHASASSVGRGIGTTSALRFGSPGGRMEMERSSKSPASHQGSVEDDGSIMGDDYQGIEPHSEAQTVESEGGMTHHGQDTIAEASDFSMIAVESLPSFQASFHASLHGEAGEPASEEYEMGEETSKIISRTLDSLRRSLQTTESSPNSATADSASRRDGERGEDQERDEMQDRSEISMNRSSPRALEKTPKRLKELPLSRQVFVGRGNVDDSFSTIPDSLLHAATPRPPSQTTGDRADRGGEADGFEDSFSEIPDAVFEAVTPGPSRHVQLSTAEDPAEDEQLHEATQAMGRRPSLDYTSNRLPTPEQTSSSNAEPNNAPEGDAAFGQQGQSGPARRVDVPSSPPIMTRPRALDFGYSNLQHELNAVKERRSSSSQQQLSSKTTSSKLQSLEAPLPPTRPSLSPIVRVGRSLQNVMSDNSSPETRERNLGSPFRGSVGSDHPRQPSVVKSPSPSNHTRRASVSNNRFQIPIASPTPLDQGHRPNLDLNFGTAPRGSGETGNSHDQGSVPEPRVEPLNQFKSHGVPDSIALTHKSPPVSSTKMDQPSEKENMVWFAHNDGFQRTSGQLSSRRIAESQSPRTNELRNMTASRSVMTNTRLQPEQAKERIDEPVQNMDTGFGEEHVDEDDEDDVDIWDIEASRASSAGPEPAQVSPRPSKPDAPPSRRSKVPSPWKRNNRRLIYKDEFASSSQIEIGESSPSEVDQPPLIQSRPRALVSQPQPQPQPQPQRYAQREAQDMVDLRRNLAQEELGERERTVSPSPGYDDFGGHAGSAHSEDSEVPEEDRKPAESRRPQWAPAPAHDDPEDPEEHGMLDEPQDIEMPAAPEPSADDSEYSLVAQQAKEASKVQDKPKQPKPGFFGGFNLSSFFSSPAALPTYKSSGSSQPEPTNYPANPQAMQETSQPKETPKRFWAGGLFPALPRSNPNANAGPSNNIMSPGSALRSTDTVADTYEPSTSLSPDRSPLGSVAPSTPERRSLPPAQQTRDAIRPEERPEERPAHASSSTAGSDDHALQEYSDEQDDSALTEGSEYERVPPRKTLSQWDRHLSPSKSSFRSPLKPTTPGRLVAFLNHDSSPSAQAQARSLLNDANNARNTISQGRPLLLPIPDNTANQRRPPATQRIRNTDYNANHTEQAGPSQAPVAAPINNQQPHATASASASTLTSTSTSTKANLALSPTTWTSRHWARLDEMLRMRRYNPARFKQVYALAARDRHRSSSSSSSALMGSEVSALDSRLTLTLERWHLDVVEAFRLEVGGFDEGALAKRVFALIMGWEKRRTVAGSPAAPT